MWSDLDPRLAAGYCELMKMMAQCEQASYSMLKEAMDGIMIEYGSHYYKGASIASDLMVVVKKDQALSDKDKVALCKDIAKRTMSHNLMGADEFLVLAKDIDPADSIYIADLESRFKDR